MWYSSFQIKNFKSFDDTGRHSLGRGINVVVGQNNSGKTALLKAIGDSRTIAAAHRDSRLSRDQPSDRLSEIELEVTCQTAELTDSVLRTDATVHVPVPHRFLNNPNAAFRLLQNKQSLAIRGLRKALHGHQLSTDNPSHPSLIFDTDNRLPIDCSLLMRTDPNRSRLQDPVVRHEGADTVGAFMVGQALGRTYYFDAYRVPSGRWRHGNSTKLANNAQNLPEVLINLQHNPSAYRRYLQQVRRVLPLVKHVSVKPISQDENEIFVWSVGEHTERDDLAVPLSECGTGIGQVLAILYVVMQSSGDIIVVDEPNSFLHPRATRELINIFRSDVSHQYIISTHSAEVISASKPERLFVLSFVDEVSKIKELNADDVTAARQVLDEIGARLSDVFGVDQVIWVEGSTEVECFPLLLAAANRRLVTGTTIASLRSTGDLEGKHADALADIYRNLSAANSLLPRNSGIVMDGDKRGNSRMKIVEKAFGKAAFFLSRRTYENYLLHEGAICALLNELPYFKGGATTAEAVQTAISTLGNNAKFGAKKFKIGSREWLEAVDAPNLLDELFQSLSANTEIFRKVSHSTALTRWILANDRPFLDPIVDELVSATTGAIEAA